MARLDTLLVARGLAPSRSRAADWIARGLVTVDGRVVAKAGAAVAEGAALALAAEVKGHVSRGAEKLLAALDRFELDTAGRNAVDIGASTGGFTEVLLARGAAHVTAIDVGHGQLHPRLATDARVTVREGTDARRLTRADFAAPIEAVTADVSFISLEKALPAILSLAAPGAWLVALVKPQFEVGPALVGKGGIVRDGQARAAAVDRVARWLETLGWQGLGTIPSPITGGDGNVEYLVAAAKPEAGRHE